MRPLVIAPEPSGRARAALAGALGAALLCGCPGTLDDQQKYIDGLGCPDTPAFFAQTCTGAGCHNATEKSGNLDLESPDLEARVNGVLSTGACASRGVLADPADPEGSVLYFKLLEAPVCGSRMPLAGDPLTDKQLSCVRAWIASLSPSPTTTSATGGTGGAGGTAGGNTGGAGGSL